MRELELRLALVCYGGASLAVYMNGISNEILKLVRASRAFHDKEQDAGERLARYSEADTEYLYAELLEVLAPKVRLRVIVDVVSGASAGGINGIYLSRALAHDLSLAPLRHMWLAYADIEKLMDEKTLADRWSKFYLYPFIGLFYRRLKILSEGDPEIEHKLMRFVRSRWFKPPFSGRTMLGWMLDAGKNMGVSDGGDSLMPPGHKLDLFVSLTNFYGQQRKLSLHDPDEVLEHQHGLTLNFSYWQRTDGTIQSDFADDNIPGLGFAARGTSSFPGAFPPVTLNHLYSYLKDKGADWPAEDAFIAKNFALLVPEKDRLRKMSFIDGGVTNNKPFASAIQAIYDRPAHREVDRRIIYVDPVPDDPRATRGQTVPAPPSFFRTILSALAEIPRREPIYGNLRAIARQNKLARRQDLVTETVEAQVLDHIDNLLALDASKSIDTALLASWREQAHKMAFEEAGYSYGAYSHTKAIHLLDHLSEILVGVAAQSGRFISLKHVQEILVGWAATAGLLPSPEQKLNGGYDQDEAFQARLLLFRGLDLDFRIRRIRFVIKKVNRLVQRMPAPSISRAAARLKKVLYASLEKYSGYLAPDLYAGLDIDWDRFLSGDPAFITETLEQFEGRMDLEELDFKLDFDLAQCLKTILDTELRRELFRAYVGFAFHDVVTLPLTVQTDIVENDEIRVDRISPLDCSDLATEGECQSLMGSKLNNFGAFFSRRARENDYILGRLHSANRLVDFLVDAAGRDALPEGFDLDGFRRRMYVTILETEAKHADKAGDIIEELLHKFRGTVG